ncbi:methyltransferase domain-containing protein [Streptomyces sp. A1499]|uniref:SAM-dependent methyltransferase n=1 Tax=Streptomyces sp. A1499 TaxID=2563104 RepID=UPI00109E87AB|nr:methyltransferase domain-containing protein [Streptomyces sp. A1499]THC55142.1 class I SAM-dependent methyltransferase [Streptomyces sp. A1499]
MPPDVASQDASLPPAAPPPGVIETSYDFAAELLSKLGGSNFHCGWWDSPADPRSLAEAQDHMTGKAIAELAVGPGDKVLDLGCGMGVPALRIARETGADVLGVSVVPSHIEEATRHAAREGLADKVRFEVADAHHLACPEASFDAVVAIESLGHMDRPVVLPLLARALKPGGRLVAYDYFLHGSASAAQQAVAEAFRGIALLSEYPRPEQIARQIADAGLDLLDFRDVTDRTATPTYARFGRIFREEVVPALAAAYSEEFLQGFLDLFAGSDACGGPHHYTQWTARRPALSGATVDSPG